MFIPELWKVFSIYRETAISEMAVLECYFYSQVAILYLVENYISIVAAQIHLSHYLLNNYQIRLNIFPNVQSTEQKCSINFKDTKILLCTRKTLLNNHLLAFYYRWLGCAST